MRALSCAGLLFLGCAGLSAAGEVTSGTGLANYSRFFDEAGTTGTMVLMDGQTMKIDFINEDRARQPLSPKSTFKIANALIALETGVIQDEWQVFLWDGVEHEIKPWNADHTLVTGIRYSVVPMFQVVARLIGQDRMDEWMEKLDYGNGDTSDGIDRFWLDGSLKISALDQARFLQKLYKRQLPVSERSMLMVSAAIINESGPDYVLRGKTGLGLPGEKDLAPGQALGWYVGYAEWKGQVTVFALNMNVSKPEHTKARVEIAKQVLRAAGKLPETP